MAVFYDNGTIEWDVQIDVIKIKIFLNLPAIVGVLLASALIAEFSRSRSCCT